MDMESKNEKMELNMLVNGNITRLRGKEFYIIKLGRILENFTITSVLVRELKISITVLNVLVCG